MSAGFELHADAAGVRLTCNGCAETVVEILSLPVELADLLADAVDHICGEGDI